MTHRFDASPRGELRRWCKRARTLAFHLRGTRDPQVEEVRWVCIDLNRGRITPREAVALLVAIDPSHMASGALTFGVGFVAAQR